MNIFMNRSRRNGVWVRGAALLVAAAVAAGTLARPVMADKGSKSLEKYERPVDQAIERALAWLAKNQTKEDGSWTRWKGNQRNVTGITSLCIMAFLAKGHTPGVGPYGEAINKGIDFILLSQRPNGLLVYGETGNGAMYCHSISTLMLAEVSGMVDPPRQKKLDAVLPKALKAILAAQRMPKDPNNAGGWRYQIDSRDSDISCTGWALMALRSARNSGAVVPQESIDMAVSYVLRCQHRESGGFTYQPGGEPGWARTGTGVLCLELCGYHPSGPSQLHERSALMGGEWILQHLSHRYGEGEFFGYAMYYCAQATFQLGDEYWEKFAAQMYSIMLPAQDKEGFWPALPGNEGEGGEFYSTSMVILAMSVPYRQLPIYQR